MSRMRPHWSIPASPWAAWIVLIAIFGRVGNAGAQDAANVVDRSPVVISERAIHHIMVRHWPDSPAAGAGKYAPGMTVDLLRQMVDEAVEKGSSRENTNGRPGRIYEYDFGHPIGIKINGRPAYSLRVVVNDRNELVTAFPF
jgi:hypothetical protein